jgi:hypothetical protein
MSCSKRSTMRGHATASIAERARRRMAISTSGACVSATAASTKPRASPGRTSTAVTPCSAWSRAAA